MEIPRNGALNVPGSESGDLFENPAASWIQQMHALESIQWRGGENFWDGPHDSFCFVCGSNMELFSCQTCENCYHAECMTPSLDPSEVPSFWFCPHCVQRELHVPPSSVETATVRTPAPVYPSPISPVAVQEKGSESNDSLSRNHGPQEPKSSHELQHKSRLRATEEDNPPAKGNQDGRDVHIPLHGKKSKYSAFSADVDKALSVLYAELETAARHGKSEGSLQDKVQGLEQTLRLQEGQMKLTNRELDLLRNDRSEEREASARLRMENAELREQVAKLEKMVEKKDSELRDWRTKLRNMMGNELE